MERPNPKSRVLIVDDDPMLAELIELQLAKKGCVVLQARTGEVGLEIMRDNQVDLVLTDFMMPNLNGMEFTRILKSRPEWADTRVIFMSANSGAEYRQRAIGLGAIDYLPKSLGVEALADKVLEHLGPASVEPPAGDIAELKQRLQQVELLTEHLIEVLPLIGMDTQLSASTAQALQLASTTARRIQATAQGHAATTSEHTPSPGVELTPVTA